MKIKKLKKKPTPSSSSFSPRAGCVASTPERRLSLASAANRPARRFDGAPPRFSHMRCPNLAFENTDIRIQQNIDFIYTNRTTDLNTVTPSNGRLIFVGEWVAEWNVKDATKEDYQRFAKAQLEVWGRATFGWAYWTLRNLNNHWSLEWMIKNGYINLLT